MSTPQTLQSKEQILSELLRNTRVDRSIALRLLHEHNWHLGSVYRRLEQMRPCTNMQNDQSKRSVQIPIQNVSASGSPRTLYTQRGGGGYPTNVGVGRVSGPAVLTSRPGYENIPIHQYAESAPKFPVDTYSRDSSSIETAEHSSERIVPIQVERGAALKLTTPMVPQPYQQTKSEPQIQKHAPQQMQHEAPAQRQDKFHESMPKSELRSASDGHVQRGKDINSSSTHKSNSGDQTPKLKRGISNIMENVNLVSEARSSVLHDIEEDSHDHMYLMTFLLPDLTIYSEDFRAYLEKDLIETSTLVSLEQAGRLNWWAEMRLSQRLMPMATSGDGNCLLHAASLAMWGIHDRQLILRNALYDKMTSSGYKDQLYRRWRWQTNITNLESGLVLSEMEWQVEWKNLLRLASPTPRTFPELSKRNSCCDSLVTKGNSSSDPVVYESLEEFHVFVLAHVLQRPIIIVADTLLKDSGGEALAPIPFGGIYLPLECGSRSCHRSPLLLTYDAAHFSALVPMETDKSSLPAAIPLVDPSFQLLPLHFHVDPGPFYDWGKGINNKGVRQLTTEDKLNLLQLYMNVEKLQIPGSACESDYDSDKMSCGSCESDDSVTCVGNKEKKKVNSVAKQFGSIGKSVGKKLKKNFGSIGKAMKHIGDSDKHRRPSVGSVITQSTKVIATIATDIGRDRVWCARLAVSRTKMQHDLVKNYLHTTQLRFERDKDLWCKKNEEIRSRASQTSIASTVACVTPGCHMFGTAQSAYLCSKCYAHQKQEALEKEDGGQFVYNTFPGRNKSNEDAVVKLGKSKFYTDVVDRAPGQADSKDSRLSVVSTMDRLQSRSLGDVNHERIPSPDYDNVDYKSSSLARPESCVAAPVTRSKVTSVPRSGDDDDLRPQTFQGNKCKTDGCDFFGSAESESLCSSCYKQRQLSIQAQARSQTRL